MKVRTLAAQQKTNITLSVPILSAVKVAMTLPKAGAAIENRQGVKSEAGRETADLEERCREGDQTNLQVKRSKVDSCSL